MTAFHSILDAFFQIKALQGPFLPKFPPNLPEKELKKHDLQNEKKRLHFDFGRPFCKIKVYKPILREFSHILPKFTQILSGF